MSDPQNHETFSARILIVDDSEEARTVLVRLLALEGFEAEEAVNGRDCLRKVDESRPDLILLDIMMPEMDGLETLRELRKTYPASVLPVIMVTALGGTQDVVRGLELGANDYITKPPQFEVLAARVRTQLRIKQLEDQRREDIIRLRQLSLMKDKFLQIAAHDLRNPLNNIFFGIQMLERFLDIDSPDIAAVLQTMHDSSGMMQSIISDFLDLGAIQAGQVRLNLDELDFNEMARTVVRQFSQYAIGKQVKLRIQVDEAMPPVIGDASRLSQVTANLVSNAIKFSPPGSRVVVRTRLQDGRAYLEVADNGPGIPAEEMPHLFREFARLSNQPTGGEKSSGVGLSIARRLVEMHEGRIGCKSKPGTGSLFWFYVPVSGPGCDDDLQG
ncbi:MAG: hybrid sensor histidine kinase/response regulator [Anaerolineae bacterium]